MKQKITSVFIFFLVMFSSCSKEGEISDVQCQILGFDEKGMITVYPYVKKYKIINEKYTGFLHGLDELNENDVALMRKLIENKIEKDYVAAGVDDNGNLSVLVLERSSGKAIDLVALFNEMKKHSK